MRARAKILAVVPARGGSKGIPKKNLARVAGISLVGRVAQLIQSLSEITHAVVSTDSDEIATEAEKHGLLAPFRRPKELSGDRIGDLDVLVHAIEQSEAHFHETFDYVLMLQPTCPLRTVAHVRAAITEIISRKAQALWTVSPVDLHFHPWKQLLIQDGVLEYFDQKNGAGIIARQQLQSTFFRNGAAYIWQRDVLLKERAILPVGSHALVIHDPMISIDTPDDLRQCEAILGITRQS